MRARKKDEAKTYWQRELWAMSGQVGTPKEAEIRRALELLKQHRPAQYRVLVLSADHTQAQTAAVVGKAQSSVSRQLATARENFAGYLRAILAQRA